MKILSYSENQVEIAHSGLECIERVIGFPFFQVILMDLDMEGLNGIQTAQKIMEISPEIPIIICTGYSNLEIKQFNVKGVLYKPIDNRLLEKELGRYCFESGNI